MADPMLDDLQPGFAEPGADAQRVFRSLLTAMSEPGRIVTVDPAFAAPPLPAALAAAILTLADHDTRLWLSPAYRAATGWVRFHTGAVLVDDPADAAFLFAAAGERPALSGLTLGDPAFPERSATLFVEVSSLSAGTGWTLSGPGIRDRHALAVTGLEPGFPDEWRANRALFPCGVDLYLTAGPALTGLPRTVVLTEG
jgi:alpha-D-ribose 1-methylphosphonate 5-triphosphate synthase subunit PhnH